MKQVSTRATSFKPQSCSQCLVADATTGGRLPSFLDKIQTRVNMDTCPDVEMIVDDCEDLQDRIRGSIV
jgi:hypothetical protein